MSVVRGLARRLRNALATRGPKPAILMYHRVARPDHDPWGLSVSPERFEEQMSWLAARCTVLPMTEFVARLLNRTLPVDAVGITFDDGYADNLSSAWPVLARLRLSATLFVVSAEMVRRDFWWDELARLILACQDAVDAPFMIAGQPVTLRWEHAAQPAPRWLATTPPRDPRQAAYIAVWTQLQRAPEAERQSVMASLRDLLPDRGRSADRGLTDAELPLLRRDRVFRFGGHTVSHPALTSLDRTACRSEVAESFRFCRQIEEDGTIGFAYPYGDLDPAVLDDVERNGFAWACSTRPGAINPSCDVFALPRLQVGEWSATELSRELQALD